MEIENQATFEKALRDGINLFSGAGFSVCAQGPQGPLPVGQQLTNALKGEFPETLKYDLELPEMYALLNSLEPDRLEKTIREWYRVSSFDGRYKAIQKLNVKNIYTTNVDNLFQEIYSECEDYYLNDLYREGAALHERSSINFGQLHGSVLDEGRPLVFGPLQIATAATNDQDRWRLLRTHVSSHPTFFWGYAMKDAGTLQTLRKSSNSDMVIGDSWIQVRPSTAASGALEFYRSLGFRTIVADTEELLDYFEGISLLQKSTNGGSKIGAGNIPSASDIPLRPIEDYFAGAAPTWSDIYSGSLVRTSHYSDLEDRIAGRRPTIIAGIPGSGKTTLLMQLAAGVTFDGPKFLFDGISEPEAKMISKRIGSAPALVLVDNVANDVGALTQFLACPNTVVIGAERDYALSSISNLIRGLGISIAGTTNVLPRDEIRLWQSIPARSRRSNQFIRPETTMSSTPSIFEIIQENVNEDPLGSRLAQYVNSLHAEKPEQAEAIVLVCYLQNSNVPISLDVLISYFGDRITDYKRLYDLMFSVGELLLEYSGAHSTEDQDYFIARSRIASETVLSKVSRSLLRKVLIRFHTHVSTARIPGYYAFKRRGYDARTFAGAFRNFQEGVDLYNLIVDREEDYVTATYILQQKALFLNLHRNHEDAFREIDLVRGRLRRRKNWTIENSYFSILFDANILKTSKSAEAMEQCKRAIKGLENAYNNDLRKHQHAIRFAKCACRLADIDDDPQIREYLVRADAMMRDLRRTDAWLNAPKHLLRDVGDHMRRLGVERSTV